MKLKSLILLVTTGSVFAQTDTMIVFDGSGSMWGQIEGKTKIEIAQNAVTKISQGFDQKQVVGLMAYGHRKKGDCGDIETLVPAAPGTAAAIAAKAQEIQPKGKTPLSNAVKKAAEQLKFTENKAEVVLITDGFETCDMDPCAVASELENLGVDFKAHVIGFGLSADQGKQVSCMAEITGGQYVSANDATSLNQALQQVIIDEESEVEVELPSANIQVPAEPVAIGSSFEVSWEGPAGSEDYIGLVNEGEQRTYGELSYAWSKTGNPSSIRAPGKPGIYDIRYVWQGPKKKHVLATASIEVVDSEVSLVAPVNVNAAELFVVDWKGPNQAGDYVDFVKKDHNRTYGELSYFYTKDEPGKGQLEAPAEPGEYLVRYVMEAPGGREVLHQIPIKVNDVDVTLAFEPSAEIVSPLTVYWTGPNNKNGYIDVVKAEDKRTYGEISYFYLKDNPESGTLTTPMEAGEYDVRFVMDGAGGRKVMAKQRLNITAVPALITGPATIASGASFTVNWQGPNRPGDYVDLIQAGKNKTYGELSYFYTKDNKGEGQLTAPEQPGEYQIRYVLQSNQRKVLTTKAITVQ